MYAEKCPELMRMYRELTREADEAGENRNFAKSLELHTQASLVWKIITR